jgi:hypothetical protein
VLRTTTGAALGTLALSLLLAFGTLALSLLLALNG